jgi:FG-GAP repeat protein/VCBS repeat protein
MCWLFLPLASLFSFQGVASPAPERPLFEPALRVLHEFVGEAAGDQFGWIGRNAGDCDGDGRADVLLSAPTKAIGGAAAGRIYVYSSKTGRLLFACDGKPGDQLGMGIETAGDVNGDGVADVIAGAPGAGGKGQALVFSGKDGARLLTLAGEAFGDGFGRKVSPAGDVDGDGCPDLLVGADLCDSYGRDAGRAYLLSGKDGHELLRLDGENAGDKFGVALCGVTLGTGAERHTLLAVGAGDAGERAGGRVYLFRLEQGEPELLYTIEPEAASVGLGRMFLSFVGDVDADGTPDVYASDWEDAGKGAGTGRIYVHSGKDGRRLLDLAGQQPGEGFGIGTADVGDVNGDGHADLLVGAWQNAEGAPSGGKCTLVSGQGGATLAAWVCTRANETFGFDTTGMGDVDGDGAPDYLVTNAWSGIAGLRSGRAFLVAGPKLAK